MLKYLTTSIARSINVYQGVSPSLLATMSLAVDIKGDTHAQLVDSLLKARLIPADEVAAWNQVDRGHFTRTEKPYQNKPYPISRGQTMTDIFTHAVIINNLGGRWKQHLRVLDVGTGHGYLCLLIAKILEGRSIRNFSITGIDINEEAIQFCQQIQGNYDLKGEITFECSDLQQYLKKQQSKFDVIIGGYYLDEGISSKLAQHLAPNGVGIWPTQSQYGQALYKLQPEKEKVYLMETLFSMPVARSAVDKYFLSEKDQQIQPPPSICQSQSSPELDTEQRIRIRKQMEDKLREQLKALLEKNRRSDGKMPTLHEMRENPEIKLKLEQLQKLAKTKIKTPLK